MSRKSLTYQENSWFLAAFVLLAGLLFFPPYFRGLFFPKEQLVAFIVALWAFFAVWMYKLSRKDLVFFRNSVDYFALAVVVCYFIAIFGAANYRLAVQGFVKVALFFLVYWVAGELVKNKSWGQILTGILYATGVGVALAGLGAALGVIEIKDGFVNNRIFSTLQYPNSLAVYLLFMSFIGFYFWATSNRWQQFLFAAGNYFILMTFLGTNSRGGILVAIVTVPVFLFGVDKEHRMWAFLSMVCTWGGVLVGSSRFIPSIVAQSPSKAWLFLGLGLAVVLIGHGTLLLVRRILGDRKAMLALAGMIGVIVAIAVVYMSQREITLNQIANPNAFKTFAGAETTLFRQEDGWNRINVTRVGDYGLAGHTDGFVVKPGETVVFSVEMNAPSGNWVPYLTETETHDIFQKHDENLWTITWTNNSDREQWKAIYFWYLGGPSQDVQEVFYFRNPTAVNQGIRITFWQKILPQQFWGRIQTIDVETILSQERIFWPKEALELIKKRPLLGYGGGGWESAYRSNQAYNYTSTQVHNDWLQLGVETGVIGLLAWLGLWISWFYSGIKIFRASRGRERTYVWAIIAGTATIGGHAVIDFDLSLGAVSIALWFGFGIVSGLISVKNSGREPSVSNRVIRGKIQAYYVPLGIGVLCLLFTLFAGSLILGLNYGRQAVAAVERGDGSGSLKYFEKASTYDPFEASYNADAAMLYLLKGDIKEAIEQGEKAAKKDRFNWQVHLNLAEIYWQQEDLDRCLQAASRARECAPLVQNVNNRVARVYVLVAIRYLENGNEEAAWEVLEKVASMPVEFTSYFEELPARVQKLWSPEKRLQVDQDLALNVGIAHYLLGDFQQAVKYLELAFENEANRAEAMIWLAAAKERLGELDEAENLLIQVSNMDENIAKNYYPIISLPNKSS